MPRLRKPYTYRTLFGGILKKDWSDVFYRKYFEKKTLDTLIRISILCYLRPRPGYQGL